MPRDLLCWPAWRWTTLWQIRKLLSSQQPQQKIQAYGYPTLGWDTGVTAHIVAVGTGAAIKNAMNCDGDVLLRH